MIITQDHIDNLIRLYSDKEGSDNALVLEILASINIRRKGRWENTDFILNTSKQQLVVEEET
jgi:hypothetical protein